MTYDQLAYDTANILEECSSNISMRLINSRLERNGIVTLEEAQFFGNIVMEVITEATDEFIPNELDV